MAGAIDQPWIFGLPKSSKEEEEEEEEEWRFQHMLKTKMVGKSLHRSSNFVWKDFFSDPWQRKTGPAYPSWARRRGRAATQNGELSHAYPSWASRRGWAPAQNGKLCENERAPPCIDESAAFVTLLRACAKNKDLRSGTRAHDHILKKGLLEKCLDALVTMYAKCGDLGKARELHGIHESLDVITWTALIAGYAQHGQGQEALNCFESMQHAGVSPDAVTFACTLKACGSIRAAHKGQQIHDEIVRQGLLGDDIVLGTALVDMYAKCGALEKARQVLEELPCRNVVSWNALIAGYAQQGHGEEALNCFQSMQREGLSPDAGTFTCILKSCGSIGVVAKGEQIHDEIARQGLLANNIVLGTAVIDMYAKCGALGKAQYVLENLPYRNVVSWNALIAGYAQQGQGEQALVCYERMQQEGLSPDVVTFTCILKSCGSIGAIDMGKHIHDEIATQGLLGNDIVLGTALVDMYAKCGDHALAQRVLEELPHRDVSSWSALIAGYAQQGQGESALNCFERMQHEGHSADVVTLTCILKACGSIGAADKGEQVHSEIARHNLLVNSVVLGPALVDMYAKCGALVKGRRVLEELAFQDVLSWNALIAGYVQQGQGEEALKSFQQMQWEGVSPNAVTFTSILKACSSIKAVDKGEEIHEEIARQGLLDDDIVLGTALVDMYAQCGALAKAQGVLEELPSRDIVAWNALVTGYVQQGEVEQAMNCFKRMQDEGLSPNAVTFTCILKACGSLGSADRGALIHDEIARRGLLGKDIVLGTSLVEMYAKCGALVKARQVLEELPFRDVTSWSALITGYAQQGQGEQALNCFEQMQWDGLTPDAVTFSCVLNACSHLGLVDDGHTYFVNMSTKYGFKADSEHYTCMVDLFGRAGHLDKAVRVIQEMPCSDYYSVWSALLGACQKWGDVNVGRWAFEHAVQVDKDDAAAYVLMANIYTAAGMQEDAKNVEAVRMAIDH